MSDLLNDDLLNDELDEELDDQALLPLLGADEDELLLSDEEIEKNVSSEAKAQLKNEAEKWVSTQLNADKLKAGAATTVVSSQNVENKIDDVIVVTTSSTSNDVSPQSTSKESEVSIQVESDVSTSEESPIKMSPNKFESKFKALDPPQSKNDEVTSTNKEIEDQLVSQTACLMSCNSVQESDGASLEIIQSSQDSTSISDELCSDPTEDGEDRLERTNIKLMVERNEHIDSSPEKYHPARYYPAKRGRGMGIRGIHYPGVRPPVRYPHINYQQYPPHPNENVNPQASAQYFPYNPRDICIGPRPPFPQNHNMGPRAEYRPTIPSGYRAQNPNDFPIYRGPRPEYPSQINGAPFNNYNPANPMQSVFRPEGNIPIQQQQHQRFDMRNRMPMPRPPGMPLQGNPPFISTQVPGAHPHPMPQNTQHPGNMIIIAAPPAPGQQQTVIPRKVLINPNFKGGVEAVKCQLMKDTQFMQAIGPHVSHLQSDEELLRQQEEFINKNRLHIEKRRHERSPERRRSRERSYSPSRRERRGDSRERREGSRGRRRRAVSRELESRDIPKRRRSGSPSRRQDRDKLDIEEDEETRAYRLEIEKQKAMREKILRDKEMRRRKAIEGKQVDEKPILIDDPLPPTKLTPVIVTGSKIISLKKKQADAASQAMIKTSKSSLIPQTQQQHHHHHHHHQQQQQQQHHSMQRTIPTAKILPETKRTITDHLLKDASTGTTSATSMAVIKPVVVKKTIKVQTDISKDSIIDEDDLLEEDLLLADTPSPPHSPQPLKTVGVTLSDKSVSCNSGNAFTSSNRRVVFKSSKDQDSSDIRKGIFDRLEKKIGVNESVKRKIQRIVIKNAE